MRHFHIIIIFILMIFTSDQSQIITCTHLPRPTNTCIHVDVYAQDGCEYRNMHENKKREHVYPIQM